MRSRAEGSRHHLITDGDGKQTVFANRQYHDSLEQLLALVQDLSFELQDAAENSSMQKFKCASAPPHEADAARRRLSQVP